MHSRDLANVNKCSKDKSYSAHLKQLRRNHGCPYIFMSQLLVCLEGGGGAILDKLVFTYIKR